MMMNLIERNETLNRTVRELMTEKIFFQPIPKFSKPKCMRTNEARAIFFEQTPLCHESTIFVGSSGRLEAPGHRFWVLPQTKTGRPTNDGDD